VYNYIRGFFAIENAEIAMQLKNGRGVSKCRNNKNIRAEN